MGRLQLTRLRLCFESMHDGIADTHPGRVRLVAHLGEGDHRPAPEDPRPQVADVVADDEAAVRTAA